MSPSTLPTHLLIPLAYLLLTATAIVLLWMAQTPASPTLPQAIALVLLSILSVLVSSATLTWALWTLASLP